MYIRIIANTILMEYFREFISFSKGFEMIFVIKFFSDIIFNELKTKKCVTWTIFVDQYRFIFVKRSFSLIGLVCPSMRHYIRTSVCTRHIALFINLGILELTYRVQTF